MAKKIKLRKQKQIKLINNPNINTTIQNYMKKAMDYMKLAENAVKNNNNESARKNSRDALEEIVNGDIFISQNKRMYNINDKIILEYKNVYEKISILVKSIYGDERPILSEDSIAGDEMYGRI